ncbi:MAG TPA: serine/threonine-protein kinase [Albitalea sp.]|nr:serine/threonine-protein kinase [Albitalea sp.]
MAGPERDESAARAAHREWLAAGTRLDDFEIVRTIGSGGFGTVYLARDCALQREVAIKEFLPTQLAFRANGLRVAVRSPELEATYAAGLRSFVNEARILANFSHPAVVKVHRFWEAHGTAYMVMPYVRGPRLRDVRRAMNAAPTEAWLRRVIDPLLDALALLHAEGIYHRDIAPDNILLPSADEPVLLDFGAARRVIGDRTQTLTAVLKPSYAPIEQYAEAATLRQGPWTDLYALGAVVTYLLHALPPPPATVRAVHDDMTPLAQSPPPGVSVNFLSAVEWALAVRPQDRPRSVHEFVSALEGRTTPPVLRAAGPWSVGSSPEPARRPAVPVQGRFALHEAEPVYAHAESVTWDTTIRLASTVTPLVPPGVGTATRTRRSTRAAAALAVAALACVAGGLAAMLRGVPVGVDASTWHELARQAPQTQLLRDVPVTTRENDPIDRGSERMRPAPLLANPAPALRPVSITSAAVEVAPQQPRRAAPLQPETVALRAGPPPKAAARHDGSRRARNTAAHARGGKAARMGPREVCSDHGFFTFDFCVVRRCEEPKFQRHPQCMALRREREERARRFDYP